jgi:hypothetical protein
MCIDLYGELNGRTKSQQATGFLREPAAHQANWHAIDGTFTPTDHTSAQLESEAGVVDELR